MTSDAVVNQNDSELRLSDICVHASSNIHFGSEIHYHGPLNVQQYVTGLPENLAGRPEVGHGLARAGLIAAASSPGDPLMSPTMTLLLPPTKDRSGHRIRVWWWAVGVLIVLVIVLASVFLSLLSLALPSDTEAKLVQTPVSEETYNPFLYTLGTNVTLSGKLRIIPRDDWQAQPTSLSNVSTLADYVVVTETGGDTCSTEALCKLQAWATQRKDIQFSRLTDIAPTFLLAGDGYAYEGRGWDTPNQCTLNQKYDRNSVCISFIGAFASKSPSNKQLLAAKQLIDQGITLGKIVQNYTIYGVRQINTKVKYPGTKLFDLIQSWPNWNNDIS